MRSKGGKERKSKRKAEVLGGRSVATFAPPPKRERKEVRGGGDMTAVISLDTSRS